MKILTLAQISQFQSMIWDFYITNKRTFAWRETQNPYHIVASEIMLQQTQTHRVIPKFAQFIETLPTFNDLAHASLHTVLHLWQGLGYNRRGKYLHEIAHKVVHEYNGMLPQDPTILVTFPGLGRATAASICAFAFNKPVAFIETNIRAVYLHTFFPIQANIPDVQLMPLIEQTLDVTNPREWYYALMDYGVHLKKTMPNPSRKSKHHTVQSKFEGSNRQIRGTIIRLLTQTATLDQKELILALQAPEERILPIISKMLTEGLIVFKDSKIAINEHI